MLEFNIWRHRQKLGLHLTQRPLAGASLVFGAGVGLGMLFASAFSSFFWWWAVGALVFGVSLLRAGLVVAREDGPET